MNASVIIIQEHVTQHIIEHNTHRAHFLLYEYFYFTYFKSILPVIPMIFHLAKVKFSL